MATPFVDDDADVSLIQERNVAILGYDEPARAHALCLRDSGVDLRVGVPGDSAAAADAEADGLRVVSAFEACEEADLVVVLSEEQPPSVLLTDAVAPNLLAGDVVVVGADVARACIDEAPLPPGVDVVRLVAWSDGATLRAEFEQGRGVPMFAAVLEDATGTAWETALSYARAVGATRAGVLRVADEQYLAATDAAQRLFQGEIVERLRQTFGRLVAEGCAPEIAYFSCFRGLADFAAGVSFGSHDLALQRSDTYADAAATVRALTHRRRRPGPGLH